MTRLALVVLVLVVLLPPRAAAETVPVTLLGKATRADIYRPAGAPSGAFILAHGFMRNRGSLSGHGAALARAGALAIVPDLPSWSDSRENGKALVELVAMARSGAFGTGAERVVLAGFSAGGLASLLAAHAPGVVGYVGLDAFDRPGGVGLAAARVLQTPAIVLRGPPSFCNAFNIAGPWTSALPNLVEDRLVENASHCDFESPTDGLCTFVCGATDPARQAIVREALLDAARRWLPPAR